MPTLSEQVAKLESELAALKAMAAAEANKKPVVLFVNDLSYPVLGYTINEDNGMIGQWCSMSDTWEDFMARVTEKYRITATRLLTR